MTEHEKYQEHIRHTHDAFCKTVIRHAAIDAARSIRSRRKREISLEYSRSRERRLWLRYYPAKQRGNPPALPKVERCTGKEHGRKAVSCLKTIGHD